MTANAESAQHSHDIRHAILPHAFTQVIYVPSSMLWRKASPDKVQSEAPLIDRMEYIAQHKMA
jgi:hypothetical protein